MYVRTVSLAFIKWLHLAILIDIHTPLIIPNRVPVDARYGETINLDALPICHPNNCNLRAVCGALSTKAVTTKPSSSQK
jgi:hypothetical protein